MSDEYDNDWGLRCPKCESSEIAIQIKVWVRLFPDGSEVQDGDQEWEHDSPAVCIDCDFEGKVSDWQAPEEESA
jgi:hypothetical protein